MPPMYKSREVHICMHMGAQYIVLAFKGLVWVHGLLLLAPRHDVCTRMSQICPEPRQSWILWFVIALTPREWGSNVSSQFIRL